MQKFRGIGLIVLFAALIMALGWAGRFAVTAQGVNYGVNWVGQYFNSTNFTNPAGTGSYPTSGLNFNFGLEPNNGAGQAVSGVGQDNWSARFTSSQTFEATNYTFTLIVDDQAVVYLGGTPVFTTTIPGTYTFNVPIPAAGNYSMQVDWVELTVTAVLQLSWTTGTGAIAPTAGPVGPQAQVINVRGLSLRSGPYLGASLVAVLRPSIAYTVVARNADEGGGFTWYRVVAGERTGWASGRYLEVTGDVNLIPFIGTEFEGIDGAPDTGVVAAPRAYLFLRRRPSIRAASLGQVPWGDQVPVLGRTIQGGESYWLQVRYNGQVGWIKANFVTVRGDLGLVPIR